MSLETTVPHNDKSALFPTDTLPYISSLLDFDMEENFKINSHHRPKKESFKIGSNHHPKKESFKIGSHHHSKRKVLKLLLTTIPKKQVY